MEPVNPAPDLAGLLAHAGWVRQLARSLTRDPEAALDLEQEAWLAALSAQARPAQDLRSWMGGVLRRLARHETRSRLHRGDREARAARPEGVPGGDELTERLELSNVLARAVLALDEPYRRTVILRHYEGLPPRRIAAREGVDVRAIETRLRRAHERLRVQLDELHGGDRGAWFPGIAALGFAGGGKTLSGAGLALAAAVLVVGGGVVGLALHEDAALSAPAVATAPAVAAQHVQAPIQEQGPGPSEPSGAREEAAAAGLASTSRELELVIVRAGDDLPLAQVEVQVGGAGWKRGGAHVTDESGRVRLRVTESMGRPSVSVPATATTRVHLENVTGLGEQWVRVPRRGGALAGRVIGRDGAPIPFAEVRAWRDGGIEVAWLEPDLVRAADARGSFRFDDLAGATGGRVNYLLTARAAGWASVHRLQLKVDGDTDERELELVLGKSWSLRGRVVDGVGSPVASVPMRFAAREWGARALEKLLPVGFEPRSKAGRPQDLPRPLLETDADGRFELELPALSWSLQVDSPRHTRWLGRVESDEFLEIRLGTGGVLTGVVLGPDGAPAVGATVRLNCRETRPPVETDADGRFRFEDLAPLEGALVLVRRSSGADCVQPVDLTEGLVHCTVRLEPARRISGRMLDAEGRPLARVLVELQGDRLIDTPWLERHRGFRWESLLRSPYEATSSDGSFAFEGLYPGVYDLRVRGVNTTTPVGAFARLDARAFDPAPLDLVWGTGLEETLTLRGRALHLDGSPLERRFFVQAERFLEGESEPMQTGVRMAFEGPSGEFELRGLEPGTWRVTVSGLEPGLEAWTCEPSPMGAGTVTLEARLAPTPR